MNPDFPNEWNPFQPKRTIKALEDVHEKTHVVINAISVICSKLSFMNPLNQEDSAFVQAMKKDDWVLLFGIESAPKELFEEISTLCFEEPFLDLFEKGPNYRYSRTVEGELKIHDDFHLFITYNSDDIEPHRRLNMSKLNKFLTFVLQPIDSTQALSGIVIYGLLQQLEIPQDLANQVSSRLVRVHHFAKDYCMEHSLGFSWKTFFFLDVNLFSVLISLVIMIYLL